MQHHISAVFFYAKNNKNLKVYYDKYRVNPYLMCWKLHSDFGI
jgi:hypothetical protein